MNIVQIGTNDATDSCFEYVIKNINKIEVLHTIEPLTSCLENIKNAYKQVKNLNIHNIAITDNSDINELTIYTPSYNLKSQHASTNYEHLIKLNNSNIIEVKIPCLTLNDFFSKNNIKKCDRLYIDTEGLDCKILLSFDLIKYDVSYIEFETAHSDGLFTKGEIYERCVKKLTNLGYSIEKNGQLNEIAIKKI
jgi:FkbM family methyltransferase